MRQNLIDNLTMRLRLKYVGDSKGDDQLVDIGDLLTAIAWLERDRGIILELVTALEEVRDWHSEPSSGGLNAERINYLIEKTRQLNEDLEKGADDA